MTDSSKQHWQQVLDYLEPKAPLYCPEKSSVQQKVFLRTNAIEALFGGAAGGGKMVSISTPVPTVRGFVPMGDVHPGDFVFGPDGTVHLVMAESDVEQVDGWRLRFDDGSEIVACEEHLWKTLDASELAALTRRDPEWRARRQGKRASRATGSQGEHKSLAVAERNRVHRPATLPPPVGTIRTTAEIVATLTTASGRTNHAIPVTKALQLPARDLPIDPYVLGAWLGDGSSGQGAVTGMDHEIIDVIAERYPLRNVTMKPDNQAATFYFTDLYAALKSIGVANNKHIPHEYLWAAEHQRLALLQGLMDTDGTVAKNSGSAEFCNTNYALASGVAHLARSLGMKATIREGRAKLNGMDCGPKWTVKFVANRIVFRLPRKAHEQKIAERRTTKFRYIVAAERVEGLPMKCIRVSEPDGMYLVGEHFIPTHNSSALLMAALQYVDVPGYSALLFRKTLADLTLPGALMDRFREWMGPYEEVKWNANTYQATFPSGARIAFGYLNNKEDYLRYKGVEAQFIGMDEVTEIRESDYRYLFSRLRRPSSGPLSRVPLRMRAATNPAPNWVRQRFIVEGPSKGRVFVPSKLTDNPGIDPDSYRRALAELDPVERLRLEQGDWWATSLGSMFPRESFEIVEESDVPDYASKTARMVRFWDLAATEVSSSNPDPDWTVGTLMLFDQGIAWVLDVKRTRSRAERVEALIEETAREDGRVTSIRMEQEPGSAGKALIDQYARYILPGYDVQGIRSTGDKISRARPFASAVANGNVRVVGGTWLTDWLDEFSAFPEATNHDDQVDSAVGAFTYLAGLGLPQRKRAVLIL